ncbi:MAG: IS30 family transposase [Bacilli bacterium]
MKNKLNTVYQKHLTLLNREDIEKLLKAGFKFYQIAENIQKDPTTISKEIRKYRTEHTPSNFNNKSNFCKHKDKCNLKNICNSNCHSECRRCGKCNSVCSKYELDICEKLLKPPYVCNSCNSYAQCRKIKYIYIANVAQKKYELTLASSREGINISEDNLQKLDDLISPLIKQGQSIKLIYANHKNEINCSIRCLYNYIEMGLLSVKNIDLPRKVRYKVRNQNQNSKKKDYSYRIGRTYEDFRNMLKENPSAHIVEMDTVIGTAETGKVLLTLLFREFNFMIARLLPDKSSKSVKDELDNIEKIIGTELYKRVFKYILTDNGGEFQRPEELETSIDGSKRSSIYYCEPNRSDQKAKVEKNHEYIRYIIPKGTSMDSYIQDDIDLMMSHINSTAREVLNFAIPYDMASIYLGMDSMKKLNLSKIQPDDIILKPYLINKKK